MNSTSWVIIPAYNESHYIERVLRKVSKEWDYIIVVDDGSSDQTTQIAKQNTKHVLTHKINLGKGAALKTGCEYAFNHLGASSVIFFDADDQHDPKLINEMADKVENASVVLGVRSFDNQMPLSRIILNRVASFMILTFFGKYIPDIPSGFKALSKEAYDTIQWKSSDYSVEMEIAARVAQYKIPYETVSIPTIYHDLDRGMTILDILNILGKVISWRFAK